MKSLARSISSNQTGIHDDLLAHVAKYREHRFLRPVASHTQLAFDQVITWLHNWHGEVIIDACCGVGESTINIANNNKQAKVLGIDKSIARLDKHNSYKHTNSEPNNYLLVQADLNDFWRLLHAFMQTESYHWRVTKQYILYPNPYPKKSQLTKRWHASPLFPYIIDICGNIEVRSNWEIYLQEFALAALQYNLQGNIAEVIAPSITPFERKYSEAGQTCFKLTMRPAGSDK